MADSVFTVTRELRSFHSAQAWVNPERIRVIHNGVNTQRFAPSAETQDRVRGELEVAADAVLIGSVGRMVPIKDYGTLLRAMNRLVDRGMNLQALLVGEGPKLESLKREASESPALRGRVKFTGASDRVAELLNAMDIFVLPSLREGMSNTLLEAMSCGLPIVASRAGGNEETISDGQSGFLFDAGDDQALADRIERLVVNAELRRAMSEAARNRALAEFSLDTMIERYRGLYLDAAAHRGIRASLR